jgi:hypothetical protein
MPNVRAYWLGDKGFVVKVRGDLDAAAVAAVARATGTPVVIDLLEARLVDVDALDALVAGTDAIIVAARPIQDALEVIALHHPVRTAPTLAAALL